MIVASGVGMEKHCKKNHMMVAEAKYRFCKKKLGVVANIVNIPVVVNALRCII